MPRRTEEQYDVFISYRRDGGAETAKHLRDILAERGYRVFFDTDSLRSGNFNHALFDIIDSCTDFILVLSPGALDRCTEEGDWVRLELAHALEQDKNVVPLMSSKFEFPPTLPDDIDAVRWQNGVTVNIEFFDAMIEKLVSFLHSKPVKRFPIAIVAAAVVALVVVVALLIPALRGGGASAPADTTDAGESTQAATSGTDATDNASDSQEATTTAPLEAKTVGYTLGDMVDVYDTAGGQREYSLSIDEVHVLPDKFKYEMWEEFDADTTALLGVRCSVENHGYGSGENGSILLRDVLDDNTVTVKDSGGFLLRYVESMYHGLDGQYPCPTGTKIPAGSKGRFCLIFYVDKDASQVTACIDSHNGEIAESDVKL